MPNLISFSVVQQQVKKYLADYDLQGVADAFGWVVLEASLGLNAVEIEEAIVDDGNDGGIDAIHITDSDVHIFTYTYTDSFDNVAKNFPQNKLDNLSVTTEKILTKMLKPNDVNPALWEKVESVWQLLAEKVPTFHFHVCSNKEQPTEQAKRRFQDSLKPYRIENIHYVSLEDLVLMQLERRRSRTDGEINFINLSYFAKADGPLKATVATVALTDLIGLIKHSGDDTQINEDVFNENVRVDLGVGNAINSGIRESALADSNYEFWYLNNGITIVCDECNYVPNVRSPRVALKNFQIVNGGQTTRTLFHAFLENREKVNPVEVLVRIIETRDRSISERISESANRQTPVRTRDLRANDWIQRKIEEDFLTRGYYYERKRNQHSDKPADRRLDAEILGQLALAYYLDMPSEAKNQKSIVYGEMYSDIFDENSVTAPKLLFPLTLYRPIEEIKRVIQRKKRRKEEVSEEEAFVSLATFHILHSMKLVAEKEGLDLNDGTAAETARSTATTLIGEVVKEQAKARGELYTHDRFFKQKETNAIISNYISEKYESSGSAAWPFAVL